MAYFAALLAHTEDGWEASEAELDTVETLADLTDLARAAAVDEQPVLVLLEQEDAWFAIVRVDGEEDPRLYVSDGATAERSSYGEIVLAETPHPAESGTEAATGIETEAAEEEANAAGASSDAVAVRPGPVGDSRVLTDLGISEEELLTLGDEGSPGDALTEISDALGCTDVLEMVR